jgi:peptidoglycan/xylan/chitin deacetylase (PgdA/CDA1 family)
VTVLRPALVGVLLAALGGAAGFVLADHTLDRETMTATVTRTKTATIAEADIALPSAVGEKRAEALERAEANDFEGLARLAAPTFKYTFGSPVSGGPAAYWREAEQRGEAPLEALAAILKLPYTLSGGIYVWPFAYDKTHDEISQHEATLLKKIPRGGATVGPEGYLGWRAGIRPDGSWVYFIAGD